MVFDQWTELARPWVAAAGGRVTRAVELARTVADGARAAGLTGFELPALHGVARLGGGGPGRDRAAAGRGAGRGAGGSALYPLWCAPLHT
ncbi:hypothetical protein GPJ59_36875, partial [Streptomyces bambusae]|nr:hypothetical protein [Streptomyces bambusae]